MTGDDLENRLRSALSARADRITAADLRPAGPPTLRAYRRLAFVLAVRALLAAAALVLVAFVLLPPRTPAPEPLAPSPSPSPSPSCVPIGIYDPGTAVGSSVPLCPYTAGPP